MPKVVDHAARKKSIVESLLRIAAREGLTAASSRAIAADIGVASSAIWYYFEDFDAVVAAAHDLIFERTNARIDGATAGLSGIEAVRAMMETILPTTEDDVTEARIVVHFWANIASNRRLAERYDGAESLWRSQLGRHLRDAAASAEIDGDGRSIQLAVDVLMTVALGQQVVAVTQGMRDTQPDPRQLVEFALNAISQRSRETR